MLILLSPAKSLDFTKIPENLQILAKKSPEIFAKSPIFENYTQSLVREMKKFQPLDLERLMSISKNLANLNFERFQNFEHSESKQALMAFDGDVYGEIDRKNFSTKDFEYCAQNLRILSGLYGILEPFSMIKAHRLEMGTNFKNFSFLAPNLYEFWGEKITNELNNFKGQLIINLASNEYFQAVIPRKLSCKLINIHFKEKVITKEEKSKKITLKTIGINAKKARGLMTNFAIKQKINNCQDLKLFNEQGYEFQKDLSDEENWFFIR